MLYMTLKFSKEKAAPKEIYITPCSAQGLETQQKWLCSEHWVDFPESSEAVHTQQQLTNMTDLSQV